MDKKENGNASEPVAERTIKPKGTLPKNEPETVESELADHIIELENELKLEKNRSDDLFRRLQYLQADFENYRKRVEREIGDVRRYGNERLLSDLLTVKDELELAYAKAEESKQNPVLLDGVGMILKRLQTLLTKEGVERIVCVGSKFDPDCHEAALRVPSDKEEGTVVEEVRPGYLLKGKVLRASIVKVAEHSPLEESDEEKESKE